MKCRRTLALLLVTAAFVVHEVASSKVVASESPVKKVVLFLTELRDEVVTDSAKEAASYATYKAWCNETITQASANVKRQTAEFEQYNRDIERLSGSVASLTAQIEYETKSLAENIQTFKEETKTRETERAEYEETTKDLKEQISDLEAAEASLNSGQSGGGSSSGSFFLQNQDPGRVRAASAIKNFLGDPKLSEKLANSDLRVLSNFARSAETRKNLQFTQVELDQPPSALDSVLSVIDETEKKFENDVKEADAEEKEQQNTFAAVEKTLTEGKALLEENLANSKLSKVTDASDLETKKTERRETWEELKANEKLLTSTQDSCKTKAYQFEQRSASRADELKGLNLAIGILTNNSSQQTFNSAAAVSFTQLASRKANQADSTSGVRQQAYGVLQAVASKYQDLKLAHIAVNVRSGGAFDKIIQRIDAQIKFLRAEEKDDVEHRDRCQTQIRDNTADLKKLSKDIQKTTTLIISMISKRNETQIKLADLNISMILTQARIVNLTAEREVERAAFLEAVKHDKEALILVESAIKQVRAFFKKNKIKLSLSQENQISLLALAHGYKPAPDAGFEDANYQGGKGGTAAVLTMMDMVAEDMQNEIENGQKDDAENQEEYETAFADFSDLLKSQKAKKITLEKLLAKLETDIGTKGETNSTLTDEKSAELEDKADLAVNCAWIKTKFGERRQKRKDEIDGLVTVKGLLQGVV